MKTLAAIFLIVAILAQATPALADDRPPFYQPTASSKAMPYIHTWTGGKHRAAEQPASQPICTFDPATETWTCSQPVMQDLNQCQWTTNGQEFICVDVCGGLSTPGTVCSYE